MYQPGGWSILFQGTQGRRGGRRQTSVWIPALKEAVSVKSQLK